MTAVVAVFVGGVLGGICRWLLRLIPAPRVGTFAANVAASAVVGFVLHVPELWQLAVGVGFAGALSTWSTLAAEIGTLIKAREYREAARYSVWTALIGLAGYTFGMIWALPPA